MKDRLPPVPHGPGAGPESGPGGGSPPRAGGRGLAHAYLDLWDRNLSDLARQGPAALGPRAAAAARAAAEARRRAAEGEAPAADPVRPSDPMEGTVEAARLAMDRILQNVGEAVDAATRAADGAPPGDDAAPGAPAPPRDPGKRPEPRAFSDLPASNPGAAPHRVGAPTPLFFHFASAAASVSQGTALAALADDPRFPWTESLAERGAALGAALRDQEGPAVGLTVAAAARAQLSEMVAGVEAWQRHPWRRTLPEPPVLWRRGATRLLDYGATTPGGPAGPPVLVVPSLVNRPYVLDLHPDRSLLRWLAAQGLRPLLLDWGDPGYEERDFDLSDYVRLRLAPAVEASRMLSPDGAAPAALGYCMGGALLAALAVGGRDRVSRLAVIGSPWNFEKLQGAARALLTLLRMEDRTVIRARLEAVGSAFGAIPVEALQLLFAALDPTLAFRKFRAFGRLPQDGARAELFAATEDWLNDGVALAQPAARELLFSWFVDNALERGAWAPEGVPARPRAIGAPMLAFCSSSDRIAPPGCAEALPAAVPGARILRPATGHVGMITGSSARRTVWEPLAAFLRG
ncbi:alpha/beta fold hydrolase [Rhodovulum sp. DZ06]|uniref:alpha/beta fold hydrolase n=1 Tax=Rhodovulum sp. DZ06 TaxID=3425126 RepID=UPI003D350772